MNKTISLPQIKKNPLKKEIQSLKQINNKKSIERKQNKIKVLENQEQKVNNNKYTQKNMRSQSLLNKKAQNNNNSLSTTLILPITNQKQEKKYGIEQNGKIKRIQQLQPSSRTLVTQRSRSSQLTDIRKNKQTVQFNQKLKKQLNQIISSGLILKKQIRTIQGHIAQTKEQILIYENQINNKNPKVQQKIQELDQKIIVVKYDNQILKNMKDRLKKIIINSQKRIYQARQHLEKTQKRNKILNDRTVVRQQSLNKNKYISNKVSLNQQQKNNQVNKQVKQYQKKLKKYSQLQQINSKKNNFKNLTQAQYHYQVHKKQQGKLKDQLYAHKIYQIMLDNLWQNYSQKYQQYQKAQKLMEIHSIKNAQLSQQQQFKPNQAYKQSFQTKKQLEKIIKLKQKKLQNTIKKNTQLKMKWDNCQFKQIDQKQRIIDQTAMPIKSGKVQEKQIIQMKHRQLMNSIKKRLNDYEEKTKKMSMIKDWAVKIQRIIEMNSQQNLSTKRKLEDRILAIMAYAKTQAKTLKSKK